MSEQLSRRAPENKKTAIADVFAVALSSLCLIHCLLLPALLVLVPALAVLPIADENFHLALVFLVIPISVFSLSLGCRKHKKWAVLIWGMLGVTILVFAAVFGHDLLGETGERYLTVVGAVLVAISHIANFRLCRVRSCDH